MEGSDTSGFEFQDMLVMSIKTSIPHLLSRSRVHLVHFGISGPDQTPNPISTDRHYTRRRSNLALEQKEHGNPHRRILHVLFDVSEAPGCFVHDGRIDRSSQGGEEQAQWLSLLDQGREADMRDHVLGTDMATNMREPAATISCGSWRHDGGKKPADFRLSPWLNSPSIRFIDMLMLVRLMGLNEAVSHENASMKPSTSSYCLGSECLFP